MIDDRRTILSFYVPPNTIKEALLSMSRSYQHMTNRVVRVDKEDDRYIVFVETTNDYPFVTDKWENNDYG